MELLSSAKEAGSVASVESPFPGGKTWQRNELSEQPEIYQKKIAQPPFAIGSILPAALAGQCCIFAREFDHSNWLTSFPRFHPLLDIMLRFTSTEIAIAQLDRISSGLASHFATFLQNSPERRVPEQLLRLTALRRTHEEFALTERYSSGQKEDFLSRGGIRVTIEIGPHPTNAQEPKIWVVGELRAENFAELYEQIDFFVVIEALCRLPQLLKGVENLAPQLIPSWKEKPLSWKYNLKLRSWEAINTLATDQ